MVAEKQGAGGRETAAAAASAAVRGSSRSKSKGRDAVVIEYATLTPKDKEEKAENLAETKRSNKNDFQTRKRITQRM